MFKVQSLQNINKYSENLQSLQVGVQVLPHYLQPEVRGKNEAQIVDNDNVVARLRDKVSKAEVTLYKRSLCQERAALLQLASLSSAR